MNRETGGNICIAVTWFPFFNSSHFVIRTFKKKLMQIEIITTQLMLLQLYHGGINSKLHDYTNTTVL